MRIISEKTMRVLLKAQQGELDAVLMYNALADRVKDERDRAVFRRLAAEEGRHAGVFRELTGKKLKAGRTKAVLLPLLYNLLGRKRLYPLIARGEYAADRSYASLANDFPSVESVKADEKRHGDTVLSLLDAE